MEFFEDDAAAQEDLEAELLRDLHLPEDPSELAMHEKVIGFGCDGDEIEGVPFTFDATGGVRDVARNLSFADLTQNTPPTTGVLDLPPVEADSLFIRGDNGVARWVTLQAGDAVDGGSAADEEAEALFNLTQRRSSFESCGISLDALRVQIEEAAAREEKRAAKSSLTQQPPQSSLPSSGGGLWVSKYTPTAFKDLLSDESVNLQLLRWLKSWDEYVFGASAKDKAVKKLAEAADAAALNGSGTVEGSTRSADARPSNRIVLVVGPPGVGKTTLAHVLANHCGYDAVEVNASMDRTVSAFDEMLTAVLQSGIARHDKMKAPTLLHSAPAALDVATDDTAFDAADALRRHYNDESRRTLMRPKCLIIDEMDGVVSSVIPLLLQKDINRPVICLANNLYAPALRELRATVEVILQVPAVQPRLLLSRLEVIVEREGLYVDRPTLAELVHVSDGDIRTCLNTLQFLCRQASSSHEVGQLLQTIKGKDATLGLWTLWTELFQRREKAKYVSALEKSFQMRMHVSTMDPGYVHFANVVRGCADVEGFLTGAFQYYPQQRYSDHDLTKTTLCANAFAAYDVVQRSAYQQQSFGIAEDYALHATAGQCFVSCSSLSRMGKLAFPREASTAQATAKENHAAIHSFATSCHPLVAAFLPDASEIATDVAPFLLASMHPTFKVPLNFTTSALWDSDRAEFEAIVARHVDYNLTYRKSEVLDPITNRRDERWVLEPPIDRLVKFERIKRPESSMRGGSAFSAGAQTSAHTVRTMATGATHLQQQRQFHAQQPQQQHQQLANSSNPGNPSQYQQQLQQQRAKEQWIGVGYRSDVRQVVTGEIQRMKIKRAAEHADKKEAAVKSKRKENPDGTGAANGATGGMAAAAAAESVVASIPKQQGISAPAPPVVITSSPPKVKKDMFGRVIQPKEPKKRTSDAAAGGGGGSSNAQPLKMVVKFTFFDGSSSAVRRPAKLSDFSFS